MAGEDMFCRVYAFQTRAGNWLQWQFAKAAPEVLREAERHALAHAHILFTSVQLYAGPHPQEEVVRWKDVRRMYYGKDARPHWAPLYFDIDCLGGLCKALDLARWLVEWFVGQLGLPEADCRVYFSGRKGFHLLVNPLALGIEPRADLTLLMKPIALGLCERLSRLGAPDLLPDPQAYSLARLLRAPDQLHPKSSLFKVELRLRELLHQGLADIKELAIGIRGDLWDPDEVSTEPVDGAAEWWREELRRVEERSVSRRLTAEVTGSKVDSSGFAVDELVTKEMPPCIEALWKTTLPVGSRNQGELQLACWAKAAGKTYDDALAFVQTWSRRNRPEDSASSVDRHVQSVVKSVYEGTSYGFSCAAVRATGIQVGCHGCEAVAPRSLKNVASLRLSYADTWAPPECVPLCEARTAVANKINAFIRGQR